MGRNGEHLSVTVRDASGALQQAIWWQAAGGRPPQGPFDLAYSARLSDFRGQRRVEVEWIAARPLEEQPVDLRQPVKQVRIRDCRGEASPAAALEKMRAGGEILVWREGLSRDTIQGCERSQLAPAQRLVIWTSPPGNAELQEALACVHPQEVILFSQDPGLDQPERFLWHLAALVKYTLRVFHGKTSLRKLAGATGQRAETIKIGLEWLAARGLIQVAFGSGDEAVLSSGGNVDSGRQAILQESLFALLEETAAYRAYFTRADPSALVGMHAEGVAG